MNTAKLVVDCAASFFSPVVLSTLCQGIELASAVGKYQLSFTPAKPNACYQVFVIFKFTVPFIPGATLAIKLVSAVLDKTKQVGENDTAAQELRRDCTDLTMSVTVV